MKRWIHAATEFNTLTSSAQWEKYDPSKVAERFEELVELSDFFYYARELHTNGQLPDASKRYLKRYSKSMYQAIEDQMNKGGDLVFRGCVALVDTKKKMMQLAAPCTFLFFATNYEDYMKECNSRQNRGLLVKTYFKNVGEIGKTEGYIPHPQLSTELTDYAKQVRAKKVWNSYLGPSMIVLSDGLELAFRVDDTVDDITLYHASLADRRCQFRIPSSTPSGHYDFSVVDDTVLQMQASRNGGKQQDFKKLFRDNDIIEWAIDNVNDSDPGWELDTPELFSEACLDFIYDHVDQISEMIGKDLTDQDIASLNDWIREECSKGDFNID